MQDTPTLPRLAAGAPFPAVEEAWGEQSAAPGLLASGGALDVASLLAAYSQGIFPWYSEGQPVLWWSPEPRMMLTVENFKLHRSLRKTLKNFCITPGCEIRIDHDFAAVMTACASSRRGEPEGQEDQQGLEGPEGQASQNSTWIMPEMIAAYTALHLAGYAHSIETWIDGRLVGGLYCTALGAAVFGESMFSRKTDASKIALCALVALCRAQGAGHIDCQQNTAHLTSLGAQTMPRAEFCALVSQAALRPALDWRFDLVYWQQLGI